MSSLDTLARRHGTRMARVGANLFRAGYQAGRAAQHAIPVDGVPLVTRAVEAIHVRLLGLGMQFDAVASPDAKAIIREEIERLIRDAIDLAGTP